MPVHINPDPQVHITFGEAHYKSPDSGMKGARTMIVSTILMIPVWMIFAWYWFCQ